MATNDINQLVKVAQRRCGQIQSDTDLLAQILEDIYSVQLALEDDPNPPRPWFLERIGDSSSAWLAGVTGDSALTLPAGFLGESEQGGLYVLATDPSSGTVTKSVVTKQSYSEIQRLNAANSPLMPGTPALYDLTPTQILFDVPLDQDYQFEFTYYMRDAVLDGTNVKTNLWTANAWNLMLWKTAHLIAAGYVRDDKMAASHFGMYGMEYKNFRGQCIERELAKKRSHRGVGK